MKKAVICCWACEHSGSVRQGRNGLVTEVLCIKLRKWVNPNSIDPECPLEDAERGE